MEDKIRNLLWSFLSSPLSILLISGGWGDGLLEALDGEIKGIVQWLDHHYYLSDDDKKAIGEKMIDAYEKWEKEHE